MSNHVAPEGQVYVCGACGKRSRDRYGEQKIDRGWDASCMLNSVLVYEDSIELGSSGRVVKCKAVEDEQTGTTQKSAQ
jgi:hypothetical protein